MSIIEIYILYSFCCRRCSSCDIQHDEHICRNVTQRNSDYNFTGTPILNENGLRIVYMKK